MLRPPAGKSSAIRVFLKSGQNSKKGSKRASGPYLPPHRRRTLVGSLSVIAHTSVSVWSRLIYKRRQPKGGSARAARTLFTHRHYLSCILKHVPSLFARLAKLLSSLSISKRDAYLNEVCVFARGMLRLSACWCGIGDPRLNKTREMYTIHSYNRPLF